MRKFLSLLMAMVLSITFANAGTVYFLNDHDWSSVYAYAWGDGGNNHAWPGVEMTKTDTQIKDKDVYSYEVSSEFNMIIFNNGQGTQTADLSLDASKPYFYIDQWYASAADIEGSGESVAYLLIGSDPAIGGESWDGSKAVALVDGKATVTLQAGDCQFKVVPSDWNWDNALGFAQVNADCSSKGVVEGTDNNNIKVTLAEAGDMTVEVKEGKLCVTGNFVTGGDDPQPAITYLLIGSDPAIGGESWDGSKAVALVDGKATVTLQAGECQFKVVPSDWNWDNALGFAQVDAECSSKGVVEGTDNNNIKVTLAEAGDMTVEVKEGKLCVTGNFVTGGDDPQPVIPDGIYLSGSFCEWSAKTEYKFARNEAAENEEFVLSTTLAENDQVKVVEIVNGEWGWYPDGVDNAYIVDADHAGNVTIYFQKTYKEDWAAFGGYIYIAVSGTGVSNTVNDVKAQKFIENGQLFIIVNGATYTVMGQIR